MPLFQPNMDMHVYLAQVLSHQWHAAGADREAYYEEAIKLGGGVEALLGFVEGPCNCGAPSAAAYVAARRRGDPALDPVTHLSPSGKISW